MVKSMKKSVAKSASKCNRGNKRGSVKVRGHTRKSGKRVLCYTKRKSVRK